MKKIAAIFSILIIVTVLLSLVGCKKQETSQNAPYDQAIRNLEQTYNGDPKAIELVAPDAVWKYLQRSGISTNMYLVDLRENQAEFIATIRKEYGNEASITVTVSDAEACSEETVANINKGLNKMYGLKMTDVQEAYRMTRSLKVTGTAEALYEGAEILTVKIGDQWYVVYDHSKGDEPIFYFPYLSQKELDEA